MSLCSHGVRIFGTNLHRFEKFGVWRQHHLPHRLWKRGRHRKSSLGRKLHAFCGLHLIAKWSCFIYVISDLFCRISIFYFCIFFKKSCLDFNLKSLMQSWLNGRKRSHDLRDGPLEKWWEGGGGWGKNQKQNSCKGKCQEKKFMHRRR